MWQSLNLVHSDGLLSVVDEFTFTNKFGGPVNVSLKRGDITKLDVKDRVDLIVISTFPNDYVPTSVSVVGALNRIGLSVQDLARDKQEDLRRTHLCWISKELPKKFPYERLMCLEQAGRSGGAESDIVVGNVFRAIIAMAPETKSVIMPILCSKAGGAIPHKMIRGIISTFYYWSKRGLRVNSLTIVMYREDAEVVDSFYQMRLAYEEVDNSKLNDATNAPLRSKSFMSDLMSMSFNKKSSGLPDMENPPSSSSSSVSAAPVSSAPAAAAPAPNKLEKKHRRRKNKKAVKRRSLLPPRFSSSTSGATRSATSVQEPTILISYDPADSALATLVKTILALDAPEIKILELPGSKKKSQTGMIPLENAEEMIDLSARVIALITGSYMMNESCIDHFNLTHYTSTGKLAPLLLEDIALPRYMTLVQYQDARPGRFQSIVPCVVSITSSVSKEFKLPSTSPNKFDVFISYSQKFAAQAIAAKEILEHLNPDIRCFVDRYNLQSGGAWQASLYDALDRSTCIFVLVSPGYLESKFCNDELAITKLIDGEGRGAAVACETVRTTEQIPSFLSKWMVKDESVFNACTRVIDVVNVFKGGDVEIVKKQISLEERMHEMKMKNLTRAFTAFRKIEGELVFKPKPTIVFVGSDRHIMDELFIVISNHELSGSIKLIPLVFNDEDVVATSHDTLETCTVIVPIISPTFLVTTACMDALHMAIFRHRNEDRCLCPIIEERFPDVGRIPSFVRLLPSILLEKTQIPYVADLIVSMSMMAALQKFDDLSTLPTSFSIH